MIFVDSNLFVYAVGRSHPLRAEAQKFFLDAATKRTPLVASVEVLQELLHIYLPVDRMETLDNALQLAIDSLDQIFDVTADAVIHARMLADEFSYLSARDLIHLSICKQNNINQIKTFDRNLAAAFRKK
ncbi:type II toxin-antitoxin system VapC family toxin [bacterium]|nr:type II toxin-antitoxin system VapC family toxin [bacterium]